jgi:hypothetical protein
VTDETTNCETGFSCEPMSTLGDSCCRPVCVCNDDLDASTTHQIRESCENGTAPWCCEELPGNGLCPD